MYPYRLVIPAVALAALVIGGVLFGAARSNAHVRPWLVVTALGVMAMPVAIVLHNVLSAVTESEEAVSFIVALAVAPLVIAVGLGGAARVLVRERHDLGVGIAVGAGGIGLFALYTVFTLVVTTIAGGNPDWQPATDAIVLTGATLAAVGGAAFSVFVLLRGGRTSTA